MTNSALSDTDTSRDKAPALSPVVEDAQPINTMLPDEPVEESHSTDESPATHQDKSLEGEDHALSGSDNVNLHPHHSDDTVSESDATEETSKLEKQNFQEASTLDTKADPGTTSMPAPTPSELEQLKHADPLSFLKIIMNVDTSSSPSPDAIPVATVGSGNQEDTSSVLRQIKERFFDVNLVDLLIRDPLKSHGLHQLLRKVDLLQVSTTVSDVLVLLGSLVEQLQADILRKRSIERELSEAIASRDSSWNSAVDATQRGEVLKLKQSEDQKAFDDHAKNIKIWKQEIKALEEKIKEAERSQATIQQSNQKELVEIVQSGITHFEAAQKLIPEIERLKKQRSVIELRMTSWESQYSKIKNNLPEGFN